MTAREYVRTLKVTYFNILTNLYYCCCYCKVTNDVAERGVMLASDFMKVLTTSTAMREKVFQVVENIRRQRPIVTKSTMNK